MKMKRDIFLVCIWGLVSIYVVSRLNDRHLENEKQRVNEPIHKDFTHPPLPAVVGEEAKVIRINFPDDF